MTYCATGSERSGFIAGLRELAQYLESNPDVPAPCGGATVHVFPPRDGNAEQRAAIDVIASRIGAQPCELTPGHYVASCRFGPVEYRAVAIDRDADDSDGERSQ
jgi:hypothetical protein